MNASEESESKITKKVPPTPLNFSVKYSGILYQIVNNFRKFRYQESLI